MKRLKKIAIVATLLILVLLAFQYPWGGSVAKRAILAGDDVPLTEDGLVDYLTITNRTIQKDVTVDNNMVVDLVQVFGTERHLSDEVGDKFLEWLGNPELPEEGYYVGPYKFADEHDPEFDSETFNETYDRLLNEPWTQEEYPIVAQWLVDQQENLDQLVRASGKEFYFHPLCNDNELGAIGALLPYAQLVREAARALTIRAMNEIANDQLEAAVSDLTAMRRLGAKMDQAPTLIQRLIGYAVLSISFKAEPELLFELARGGELSNEAIDGFRNVVRETSSSADLSTCLALGERPMMLDGIQRLERGSAGYIQALPGLMGGGSSTDGNFPIQIFARATNWNVAADKCEQLYERIENSLKIENDNDRRIALVALEAELEAADQKNIPRMIFQMLAGANSRGELAGDIVISMMTPAMLQVEDARVRVKAFGITDVGLALELYRRKNGSFPGKLDEISPEFIKSVPLDPFSGVELSYQATDTGYRLWSIGRDQVDQQLDADGKLVERKHPGDPDYQHNDDIVLDVGPRRSK